MELRHLHHFVAVAEEGSFTRAAQRLGMAQPPLSQQVARLERELGVRLLERGPRGVRLTPAGQALLDESRQLLVRSDETRRIVQSVGAGGSGSVRIGAVASAFHGVLAPALRVYRRDHPGVLPLVYELEATPLLDHVAHGRLDLTFQRTRGPHPGVVVHPLAPESLVACVADDHPVTAAAAVPLEALAGEPFALFPRNSAPEAFDAIATACQEAGFAPDVVYEAPNDHALTGLVAAGIAVSLVPSSTRHLLVPGVTYLPLARRAPAATLAAVLPASGAVDPAAALLEVVLGLALPRDLPVQPAEAVAALEVGSTPLPAGAAARAPVS